MKSDFTPFDLTWPCVNLQHYGKDGKWAMDWEEQGPNHTLEDDFDAHRIVVDAFKAMGVRTMKLII